MIDADDSLCDHNFTREEAATALEEQDGHVGRTINRLLLRTGQLPELRRALSMSAPLMRRDARAENSWSNHNNDVPSTRAPSPQGRRRSLTGSETDSLDALLIQDAINQQFSRSHNSSRSGSTRGSRRPSLVNFNVYHGRLQHPDVVAEARRQEERLLSERGPGAYDAVIPLRRAPGPLITPVPVIELPWTPRDVDCAPPLRLRRPPPSTTVELAADRPTPEFASRLTRAMTCTSAMRFGLPPPPASRPVSVSSPRKRPKEKTLAVEESRRVVDRLHQGSTRSLNAARQDRTEQHNSLQWGSGRAVLFASPF